MMYQTMNHAYAALVAQISREGITQTTRKGRVLHALHNASFTLEHPMECLATCREMSMGYLVNELKWYVSGSLKLKDAIACSKFWANCSDDGDTINSNYGYLLFHKRNKHLFTQFEHALNCLKNNPQSKKAVMTLYDNEHAYMSNDNPCTMFLNTQIVEGKLNLTAVMRSSDMYFGLPYDVPFFVFVQWLLVQHMNEAGYSVEMGTYTHLAMNLHAYDDKIPLLTKAHRLMTEQGLLPECDPLESCCPSVTETFLNIRVLLEGHIMFSRYRAEAKRCMKLDRLDGKIPSHSFFMNHAWGMASHSKCLKKHVGAVLYDPLTGCMFGAFGGRKEEVCVECARDTDEKFYSDGCWSVHGEMKVIVEALASGVTDLTHATVYTTHGPCDACLKLCDFVGIKVVVYDEPYKTDYTHWPNINVLQMSEIIRDPADS